MCSFLNLVKNNTVKTKTNNIPSYLTNADKAAVTNDKYTKFLFELYINVNEIITSKTYKESVIPNIEFCIMCGSNANSIAPINERCLLKKFLT